MEALNTNVPATSSFVIVPTPVSSAIVALVGLLSTTLNASSASGIVSPLTTIPRVWVVVPGANVSVPLAVV